MQTTCSSTYGIKKDTAYQYENIIPNVKYSQRSIMMRCCFAASGPEQLATLNTKMNF